ncbi:MAG: hypothetical protein PVG89_16020 [Gammaproteobacteria bacterium]|jgi:tetratricopeptide (TPR) repeat protein
MKNLYSYSFLALFLISAVLLNGCSFTEEQETPAADQSTQVDISSTGAESQQAVSPTSTDNDEEKTAQAPEKEPEPVVEVIPSEAANEELTVEPMEQKPEPQAIKQQMAEPSEPQQELKTAKAKPAESMLPKTDKKAEQKDIPVSTGPNHFVITAAKKDQTHPNYGKGHKMGFVINNVQGKEIVLERGKTYKFDVVTDPKHDVYISLKAIGWGSTPYTKGIEGMYTYKGTMTIKPTKETPDVLYYSCRNHPYMGGKIHIVDPGETVQIAKATPSASAANSKPQQTQVSAGDVNQKIMFADMLLKSKNSQTVMKSHISEAIDLHKQAMSELAAARVSLKSGDNQQAYKQADNAVELLKQSHKLVPNETALEHMKERYTELQASIKDFEASHKENYDRIAKKQGKEAAVDYDKAAVTEFINTAEQSAKDGDYLKANRNLEKAQRAITVAIHKMLNNQTIVYDLNFESAEEEYQYELRRFQGYEELVPIAVEQKKPKAGAKKLMESFVKKGTDLRDRAVKAAEAGDYPTAIAMLQDATKDVRRGLRMIGVMQ